MSKTRKIRRMRKQLERAAAEVQVAKESQVKAEQHAKNVSVLANRLQRNVKWVDNFLRNVVGISRHNSAAYAPDIKYGVDGSVMWAAPVEPGPWHARSAVGGVPTNLAVSDVRMADLVADVVARRDDCAGKVDVGVHFYGTGSSGKLRYYTSIPEQTLNSAECTAVILRELLSDAIERGSTDISSILTPRRR